MLNNNRQKEHKAHVAFFNKIKNKLIMMDKEIKS